MVAYERADCTFNYSCGPSCLKVDNANPRLNINQDILFSIPKHSPHHCHSKCQCRTVWRIYKSHADIIRFEGLIRAKCLLGREKLIESKPSARCYGNYGWLREELHTV